jgi:hypothetical protein
MRMTQIQVQGPPSSGKEGLTAGKGLIMYKTTSKDKPYQDGCPARRFPHMPPSGLLGFRRSLWRCCY